MNSSAPQDFLSARRNVVEMPHGELNARLAAIAASFGEKWLAGSASSPLQRLWRRTDPLATNELLNFGNALQRLEREDPAWLAQQVALIKTGDRGNAAGAIFEILALNLFLRSSCTVRPASASKAGYDGTLLFKDGSSALVSIKNHGMSNHEREFHEAAREFDTAFQQKLTQTGLRDVQLRVLFARHPDKAAWLKITADMGRMFDQEGVDGKSDGAWDMTVMPIGDTYGTLSPSYCSSSCQVLAPHHRNEQDKFLEDIRKGCANLVSQTRNMTGDDICRMIILRLSATASIAKCLEWAQWYFGDNPDSPVGVILLYQTAVVGSTPNSSEVTHFLVQAIGPNFGRWQSREDGTRRKLPAMSILVGTIADQPIRLELKADDGSSTDISGYYTYQRGDLYRTREPVGGLTVDLEKPAPGVLIHLVIESDEFSPVLVRNTSNRNETLELLP